MTKSRHTPDSFPTPVLLLLKSIILCNTLGALQIRN